jgi:hypothetical protein
VSLMSKTVKRLRLQRSALLKAALACRRRLGRSGV